MKRSLTTRGAVTLVATAGVTVLLSGVSYAVWSVTGTGEGTAAATTAQPLGVTVSPVTDLYPGVSRPGSVVVTNPNPFPVRVTGLSFDAATADAQHSACTSSISGVAFASGAPVTVTVPARTGGTAGTADLPFTVSMTTASDNSCQGATFTSTASVTGTS